MAVRRNRGARNPASEPGELAFPTMDPGFEVPVRVTWVCEAHSPFAEAQAFVRHHSTVMSLEYLCEGMMELEQDGRRCRIGPGEVAVLKLGAEQRLRFTGRRGNRKIFAIVEGNAAVRIMSKLPARIVPPEGSTIPSLFESMYDTAGNYGEEHTLRASELAYALLLRLVHCCVGRQDRFTGGACLEAAVVYLNEHVYERVTVARIAAATNVSMSHLQHLFAKHLGTTPLAYHRELKMKLARSFLTQTALPGKQIAAILGYEDPLYFSAVFKRITGESPTRFRRERSASNAGGTPQTH